MSAVKRGKLTKHPVHVIGLFRMVLWLNIYLYGCGKSFGRIGVCAQYSLRPKNDEFRIS